MALVVRVWIDGDPDNDTPFVELSEDSVVVQQGVKDAAARGEGGEALAAVVGACGRASNLLSIYCANASLTAEDKQAQLDQLQAKIAVLEAVKPITVDMTVVDALKNK